VVIYHNRSGCKSMTSLLFKPGDKGKDVKVLQHTLNAAIEAYCPRHKPSDIIEADGDYGPLTARSVRMVQRARDLEVDAVAGPYTLNQLFDVVREDVRIDTIETFRTRPGSSSPFAPPGMPGRRPGSRPGTSPIVRRPSQVHFGTVGLLLGFPNVPAPLQDSPRSYADLPANLRDVPKRTEPLTTERPPTPPPETTRKWVYRNNPFGFSLNLELVPNEFISPRKAQMATAISGVFITPKFGPHKKNSVRFGGEVKVYDGAVKDSSLWALFNYTPYNLFDHKVELGRISRLTLFAAPAIEAQAVGSFAYKMFLAKIFAHAKVGTSIAIGERVYVSIWGKAGALFCAQIDKDGASLTCTPASAAISGYFKTGIEFILRFGHRPSR
jgi:hypothetical protein